MISTNIDYLGLHDEFIPLIAQWHQNEWAHISPELTTKLRIELYKSYKNTPTVPCCLLALVDSEPAGTASIVLSDMDSHEHLSPWLASVYVHENYRCQGIATQLIEKCLENARQANIKTIYLFTPGQAHFYMKRGWKLIESTFYHGENVDIMSYDLNTLNMPLN